MFKAFRRHPQVSEINNDQKHHAMLPAEFYIYCHTTELNRTTDNHEKTSCLYYILHRRPIAHDLVGLVKTGPTSTTTTTVVPEVPFSVMHFHGRYQAKELAVHVPCP